MKAADAIGKNTFGYNPEVSINTECDFKATCGIVGNKALIRNPANGTHQTHVRELSLNFRAKVLTIADVVMINACREKD